MNMKRRLPQYIIGVILMAVGVVLAKKAEVGISPITSLPAALSDLARMANPDTIFTLGNLTIVFHILCLAAQIIITRRIDIKTALILVLAFCFGYVIDFFMMLMSFELTNIWLRCLSCAAGIVCNGVGVATIVGADLMLPAPDALMHAISAKIGKPHSKVKIAGDVTWVTLTVIVELIFRGRLLSVNFGTIASAIFTGKTIGFVNKHFPQIKMPPTDFKKTAEKSE